ncbi:hypothetical protein ABGB18_11865 [Nonomuraea sp. B12E4]|uniref:hypothetical protein n=1 Tax=Nonomuraea sp. B12E4 TaxID=3153564 RepID=UPI00325CB80A
MQHQHGSGDRAEHGRILSDGPSGCHHLLEELEQVRDVAARGLEVAGGLGHGDLLVVEGRAREHADRGRQVALGGQFAHPGDGVADGRLLLRVQHAPHQRLQEGHRVHRVGPRCHAECQVGAGGPALQPGRFPDAVDVGEDVAAATVNSPAFDPK